MRNIRAYSGSYAYGGGKGVYVFEVDPAAGTLSSPRLVLELENPSWITAIGGDRLLVNREVADFNGDPEGGVVLLRAMPDGSLRQMDACGSGGAGPCHICWSKRHGVAFISNYAGGSVGVVNVTDDGRLEKQGTLVHHGNGPRQEQQSPHVHCCVISPDERLLYTADLGIDRVVVYDLSTGTASPAKCGEIVFPPGSGPRHCALSSDGRILYTVCELSNELVTANALTGGILSRCDILPEPARTFAASAALCVLSDDKVAASCRGVDCVSFFDIAQGTARRSLTIPIDGSFARDLAFLPGGSGAFLVACEKSDCIQLLRPEREGICVLARLSLPCPAGICLI